MITPSEFVNKWKAILYEEPLKFSADTLENIAIDEEAKRFLIAAGLPDSAPPFLTFIPGLPSMCEQYGLHENYENYKYIGHTGEGNPICLNENDGSIVFLDHERDFEYEIFINSSIPQLAESLLAYVQFNNQYSEEEEDKANSERLKKWLAEELKRIDPPAMEGGLWEAELESLDEEE